jgi:hypothetical protein
MKKAAALFVALFGVFSCSDSDTALVEKELLIEEVNDTETGQYYKFFYHPDSTLQKIELYQDGLVREWAVNYAPGTQTITEIIESIEDLGYVHPFKFVYNSEHQVDSANFYAVENPAQKEGGLVYTYDANGQLVEFRFWNIYDVNVTYELQFDGNSNLTGYEDEFSEYELDYSSVVNPLYRFGLPVHALHFASTSSNFHEFLSKHRPRSVVYIVDGERSTGKISLSKNKFNYPTREKHAIRDTVWSDVHFTYYE